MLREFQEEIEKLKQKLAGRGGIPRKSSLILALETVFWSDRRAWISGMSEEEVLELKKKEIEEAKHQTEEEKAKLIKEAKKKAKGLLVLSFRFQN